jgi:hypothetical protein
MALRQHIVTPTMSREQVEDLMCRPPAVVWGKANYFPIRAQRAVSATDDLGGEDPYLIDPTKRDPAPELNWLLSHYYSIVTPTVWQGAESPYGQETIRCCALNRVELVQARTATLNELRLQRTEILEELEESADNPGKTDDHLKKAVIRAVALRRYYDSDRPYAGMARAFVEAFERELRQWQPAKTSPSKEGAHV